MNGRKAREIRQLAWDVVLAHGVRTGSARPYQFRRVAKRMKRDYTRTGRLPRVVSLPGVPESAFRRRSR